MMYWLTLPLIAVNISIVCALMALREKFRGTTLTILVVLVGMWLVLANNLLSLASGLGPKS